MSSYKVAQDVEAEDKLIGPFSFRQFIYLIIVALAIGIAWALSRVLLPLAIIPLPVILFFGALALPLKKDQPMETYLAAIMSFYLKPRKRLWQPDGVQQLIEITVPAIDEPSRTKDLAEDEALRRLSYLADIADSRGWSIRHSATPNANNASMIGDVYQEAQQVQDPLSDDGGVAQSFNNMISEADQRRHQEAIARMQQHAAMANQQTQATTQQMQTPMPAQHIDTQDHPELTFNPYPHAMKQSTITPISDQPVQAPQPVQQPIQEEPQLPEETAPSTSATPPSAGIISLANNSDLSIETIAREAKRIKEKEEKDEEVVISLR